MIGYLKGSIVEKDEKSLIVLAGQVGYKVQGSSALVAQQKIGNSVDLHIHTSVKENDISLYGFAKKEELVFFEQLIGVSGIGPKIALEVLSAPLSLVQKAIMESDAATLSKIKGLGKKTAEKLCLELRNKVTPSRLTPETQPHRSAADSEEAVMALEGLGYERFHILKVMASLPANVKGTEEIVKYVLKNN